jgi:hypothetical protein
VSAIFMEPAIANDHAAEQCLERAVAAAETRGARFWKLRAGVALARLSLVGSPARLPAAARLRGVSAAGGLLRKDVGVGQRPQPESGAALMRT